MSTNLVRILVEPERTTTYDRDLRGDITLAAEPLSFRDVRYAIAICGAV